MSWRGGCRIGHMLGFFCHSCSQDRNRSELEDKRCGCAHPAVESGSSVPSFLGFGRFGDKLLIFMDASGGEDSSELWAVCV